MNWQHKQFKDILPWNISQIMTNTDAITTRIVINYAIKQGILFPVGQKVSGNWDNNMIRMVEWKESLCRTNTGVRGKKEIQKKRTVRVRVRDASRKVNHMKKVICDRKFTTEFIMSISSMRIGSPVLRINVNSPMLRPMLRPMLKTNEIMHRWNRWNRINNCT